MASAPAALLLVLLLACLAGRSEAAGAAAVLQNVSCSAGGNHTAGDAYTANLYQLLAELPDRTVTKNGGFFNGTVGAPGAPGTAYGLALCSADFNRSDCLDCLATATNNASGVLKRCPAGGGSGMAMYDQCLLHYSDEDFFGLNYTDVKYISVGAADPATSLRSTYMQAVKNAFVQLSAEASTSPARFAATKAWPYALAQCTWDMSPGNCTACINGLVPGVTEFTTLKTTAEAKAYSCRIRHSNDSFLVYPFVVSGPTTPGGQDGHVDGDNQSTRNRTVIAVVVSVGGALALLLIGAVAVCRRRRARRAGSITLNGKSVPIDHLQEYTFEELKKATGGFSKDSELGRGAFGVVYRGVLPNGKVLAVKKLQRAETVEVEQFMNEVSILSGLKHKNLVKLEGYCVHQGTQGLLCYEFIPDGTLEDRLHGKSTSPSSKKMSWKERLHVLVGIGRGLQYLHDESPNDISIMHMDLKTDNILLQVQVQPKGAIDDRVITPKISDFGISRNLHNDKQHEYVVQVVGNTSCVPREFIERGKASTKVDIFSFGLIILEMVTGKPRGSWSSTAQEKRHSEGFIKQVRELWEEKKIEKLKDASMDGGGAGEHDGEIEKCVEIALECVHEDPDKRPDIADIIRRLTDITHLNKQHKF